MRKNIIDDLIGNISSWVKEKGLYKDTEKGLYFYLKGDTWEVGASLPLPFKDSLGESVSLELETDKPYIYNSEHVKQYPSKKSKI